MEQQKKHGDSKFIIGVVVLMLALGCIASIVKGNGTTASSSTSSNQSTTVIEQEDTGVTKPVETATEIEATTLKFTITGDELGEYGSTVYFNKGTEDELTKIAYHIPAGTYKATVTTKYSGQLSVYSDETHTTDSGYEEAVDAPFVAVANPGEPVEFTIKDGYYLAVNINGSVDFEKID